MRTSHITPLTGLLILLVRLAMAGGISLESAQPVAVPYLLTFSTTEAASPSPAASLSETAWKGLNADQRAVLAWTDRQFRSYFDSRTFDGWTEKERADLERRSLDALHGPMTPEYYRAINTLAAVRSSNALPRLREIAFERVDRNNRDRWMAIRALGLMDDRSSVPELIHLVYHGNVNTHWWAQISLVRLTGQNFGSDWNAWGKWWNESGGQPPYKPEIIRWWAGQPEPDRLADSLAESDRQFLESLNPETAARPPSAAEVAARLRTQMPLMDGIRWRWRDAFGAVQNQESSNALAALKPLVPLIQEFRDKMRGTALEAGASDSVEKARLLMGAVERNDWQAVQALTDSLMSLGQSMEEQVKTAMEASPPPGPASLAGLTNAVTLQRDDGAQKGVQSISASGHAVEFERAEDTNMRVPYMVRHQRAGPFVEAVHLFASRYGTEEPPAEDFCVYLLNDQQQVLAELKYPYSTIERGEPNWYTLRTPSIEVPEKFLVAVNFNPHQTKGVYLAYSGTNGPDCHSFTGLPEEGYRFWKPLEWMVRVTLAGEPSKAKGFQRLADWKPSVTADPFAGCRLAMFGGDKSEGQQSYGGSGPAIRFKPSEVVSGLKPGQPVVVKGVRLYASRYGSGYSPEETKLQVIVRDAEGASLAEEDFAYANFAYQTRWVDLVFAKPLTRPQPGDWVTIAFDPGATQNKGVYFHYQKNPPTSHSLAGTVSSGFKELTDREWLVRVALEQRPD